MRDAAPKGISKRSLQRRDTSSHYQQRGEGCNHSNAKRLLTVMKLLESHAPGALRVAVPTAPANLSMATKAQRRFAKR